MADDNFDCVYVNFVTPFFVDNESIAREIVLAHGGRIWLANRPEGGAEAGFSLPVIGS